MVGSIFEEWVWDGGLLSWGCYCRGGGFLGIKFYCGVMDVWIRVTCGVCVINSFATWVGGMG